MIKRRLSHLPRLPHKPKPKKTTATKRTPSLQKHIERELAEGELFNALDGVHDGLRCSSNRGMISTKLQGR